MKRILLSTILIFFVGFLIPSCSSVSSEEKQAALQAESLYSSLRVVCSEQKVEGSAPYEATREIHPMMIYFVGEWPKDFELIYDDSWKPKSIGEAQLVSCIHPEEARMVEECQYVMGFTIRRYRYEVLLEVYAANTGQLLFIDRVIGTDPGPCPGFGSSDDPDIYGSHVVEGLDYSNKISLEKSEIYWYLQNIVIGEWTLQ